MANVLERVLRVGEGRTLKRLKAYAEAINRLEEDFSDLTDDELKNETAELRERYGNGESLDDLLPEAFAAVREAAKRTLGMRHFDVQLMGGAALHLGNSRLLKMVGTSLGRRGGSGVTEGSGFRPETSTGNASPNAEPKREPPP